MELTLIIVGLIGLWIGTKFIINSSLGIATKFKLSHSFVGVAILAVGTDLPEVFVSLKASFLQLKGIESSGIITGNAIGSCISQITLILGVAGLFLKFSISRKDFIRDGTALLGSIILLYLFGMDGRITRLEGATMLMLYIIYYVVLIKTQTAAEEEEGNGGVIYSNTKLALMLLAGFVILIFASHLVVDNSMLLADKMGVAQSFVGIVIIGLGTSLPELAVSIGAAFKKAAGMSVGNVIGSNIFDGLIPIGLGGTISEISLDSNLMKVDIPLLFAATLFVLLFLRTKRGISRPEGIVLLLMFAGYLLIKISSTL